MRHLTHEKTWTRFLKEHGVKYVLMQQLPAKLEGFAIAFANGSFFVDRIAHRAKEKGLKVIWSGEMMWHFPGELDAVKEGIVDKVLYTSEFQRSALAPGHGQLSFAITGNYIDSEIFPFKERHNPTFTIGRLSRAAPEKYPEDFPVFYEALEIPEVRFRVMGWSEKLEHKYRWHEFDHRWELLREEQETQLEFLHSLDLFVYPLGHKFKESWGRSTVEAMLTGCIPLVPTGHHFENLIVHGESGFLCYDFIDFYQYSHDLFYKYDLRKQMAKQCREHAVTKLCKEEEHLKLWMEVFQ